jgi:hypothetical protein
VPRARCPCQARSGVANRDRNGVRTEPVYPEIFPNRGFGGIRTLKVIDTSYDGVWFIPTGGIGTQNLGVYLKLSLLPACGGSWLALGNLISGAVIVIKYKIGFVCRVCGRIVLVNLGLIIEDKPTGLTFDAMYLEIC